MTKSGPGKPYRKFRQKLICLLIPAMILGMFQPAIFSIQPVYAASPDFGSVAPADLQIGGTHDEAFPFATGKTDVTGSFLPETGVVSRQVV